MQPIGLAYMTTRSIAVRVVVDRASGLTMFTRSRTGRDGTGAGSCRPDKIARSLSSFDDDTLSYACRYRDYVYQYFTSTREISLKINQSIFVF